MSISSGPHSLVSHRPIGQLPSPTLSVLVVNGVVKLLLFETSSALGSQPSPPGL